MKVPSRIRIGRTRGHGITNAWTPNQKSSAFRRVFGLGLPSVGEVDEFENRNFFSVADEVGDGYDPAGIRNLSKFPELRECRFEIRLVVFRPFGKTHRFDAEESVHVSDGRFLSRKGENGDVRAVCRREPGQTPGFRKDENRFGFEVLGRIDGVFDENLFFPVAFRESGVRIFLMFRNEMAFGRFDDALHHRDRLEWIFPGRRLAREHRGISTLGDGVENVGNFGAGREGVFDHRFEHVGRNDTEFAHFPGHADNFFLEEGKGFDGYLDSEVSAGDHHSVGGFENSPEVFHSFLIFNFRNDFHVPRPVFR